MTKKQLLERLNLIIQEMTTNGLNNQKEALESYSASNIEQDQGNLSEARKLVEHGRYCQGRHSAFSEMWHVLIHLVHDLEKRKN